jgi:protein subunit release factor B
MNSWGGVVLRSPVRPEKQRELEEKMRRLGVREEDLEEGNIRCPGRGGQKLNKTSSGISLFHGPTGIRVKCCESRSQALNRFLARRRLVETIEKQQSGTKSPEALRTEKQRKQKERRKRRSRKKRAGDPSGNDE